MHASQFRVAVSMGGKSSPQLHPVGQPSASVVQVGIVVNDPSLGLSVHIDRFGADIEDATVTLNGYVLDLSHPIHGERATWGSYRLVLPEALFTRYDIATMLLGDDGEPAIVRLEARIHHNDPELLERINQLPEAVALTSEGDVLEDDAAKERLYYHLRGDVTIELLFCREEEPLHKLGFSAPGEWFH